MPNQSARRLEWGGGDCRGRVSHRGVETGRHRRRVGTRRQWPNHSARRLEWGGGDCRGRGSHRGVAFGLIIAGAHSRFASGRFSGHPLAGGVLIFNAATCAIFTRRLRLAEFRSRLRGVSLQEPENSNFQKIAVVFNNS